MKSRYTDNMEEDGDEMERAGDERGCKLNGYLVTYDAAKGGWRRNFSDAQCRGKGC